MLPEPLFLVDGSGYLYRAYFAIRHLSSPDGFPTNAIFGVTQMLLKLIRDENPSYLAVVFDAGRQTFRTEIYPDYKANRAAMPDDLRIQIEPLLETIRAFSIPVIQQEGFEADDIIATIATRTATEGRPVVVVTGDKDLMQIVGERITLHDTMKGKRTDRDGVKERFGVLPHQVVDILALMGDASDNIPGVPGIGEKTAIKLIQQYRSLDDLLANADQISGKSGERLRQFADQARLSQRLATIDRNVPIPFSLEDARISPPDRPKLAELFRRYGFSTLMKELTSESTLSTDQYRAVLTERDLDQLVVELTTAPSFAVDTETTSLSPMDARLVGISISTRPHAAWYIPLRHDGVEGSTLPMDLVMERIAPFLTDPMKMKIGQNLKYDLQIFLNEGVTLSPLSFDTMIASYLVNPGRPNHGLDSLALDLLDHRMISYDEVTAKGTIPFARVPIPEATRYAAEDADATLLLYQILSPLLDESGQRELFETVEMPLVSILARMERTGVLLDTELLREMSLRFAERLSELEREIHAEAGHPFNINSTKQLGEVLFGEMKLPTGRKTKLKTGWSTNIDELERLASLDIRIAHLLIDYRTLAKLKSTYTDTIPSLVHPVTGRVHTSYNQTVTATGRLSSSEPNLQNIPVRTEEGRGIRRAFIAPEGHFLLSADYSQIELRVLAHLSGDPLLCESFDRNEDIHLRTASEIFELFPEMVTPEMRRQAKAINFGVIYGQGAFSLSRQLGVPRSVAEEFITRYRSRYSAAMAFLDGCIRQAREQGHVRTILGRRLPIPDINSANYTARGFAERNAINYPIQGSAADIIKKAMVAIDRRITQEGLESRMIMQVHDELVFEIPEGELDAMKRLVSHEMEHAVPLSVPLTVEMGYGRCWSDAH
ncbi:MAG: DNA polymerase I [Desulfuromonadia bacterium]